MRPVPPALEPRSIPVSKFRKYAGYVIMFVLMSMLIISFALWGIGDMLKLGGTSREVAHVGGTQIQRQTGQRPEPEQALRFGLHLRALEDVLQRAIIDNAMQQYGLVVGTNEVQAVIARNPT